MANSIQKRLVEVTVQAVKELYNADILENQIALQATRKEFEGQITIVTFPVTRFEIFSGTNRKGNRCIFATAYC